MLDTQMSCIRILSQGVPQVCSQFPEDPPHFVLSWSPIRFTQSEGMVNNLNIYQQSRYYCQPLGYVLEIASFSGCRSLNYSVIFHADAV